MIRKIFRWPNVKNTVYKKIQFKRNCLYFLLISLHWGWVCLPFLSRLYYPSLQWWVSEDIVLLLLRRSQNLQRGERWLPWNRWDGTCQGCIFHLDTNLDMPGKRKFLFEKKPPLDYLVLSMSHTLDCSLMWDSHPWGFDFSHMKKPAKQATRA